MGQTGPEEHAGQESPSGAICGTSVQGWAVTLASISVRALDRTGRVLSATSDGRRSTRLRRYVSHRIEFSCAQYAPSTSGKSDGLQ